MAPTKKRSSRQSTKAAVRKSASRKTAKRSTTASVPGISRIDQDSTRTHGWFVRTGYYRNAQDRWAPRNTKFFGDATWGGKEKGLKAAIKWLKSLKH